jgi:RTX calcium-binding nonapeptide repeat (4 copies)
MAFTDGVVAVHPGSAIAGGAILAVGSVELGVNDTANLIVDCSADPPCLPSSSGATQVGLRYSPLNAEAFSAGDGAEGWGAADAASGLTGHANGNEGVPVNMTVESFTATRVAAVSTVKISDPSLPGHELTVSHDFRAGEGDAFLAEVTIANSGTLPLNDVRYRRVMDWDPEPTPQHQWVTIRGAAAAANVLFDSDDGLASADPLSGHSYQESQAVCGAGYAGACEFTDLGTSGPYPASQNPADNGALFDLGFGQLPPGQSARFFMVYGAAEGTPERQPRPTFFFENPEFQFAEVGSFAEADCPDSAVPGDPMGCAALPPNAGVEQGVPVTFFFALAEVGGCPGGASSTGSVVGGTDAGEIFSGTTGSDAICTLGGDDRIKTFDGEDFIFTGLGNDRAKGGGRFDLIVGGPGRDRLRGQGHGDALVGGSGRDILIGGPGGDDLVGGRGRDVCKLGSGNLHTYSGCEETSGG